MKEKEIRESLGFNDNIVYHYCSIEAMYGIFSSKSFWLTYLESSNDTMELKLAEKVLAEALKQLKEEFPSQEYIDMFEQIELAPKDKGYKKYLSKHKYFGERYANNAKGVCIGLNVALIDNLFSVYALPDIATNWLQTTEIVYSYEEQLDYAKSLIIAKIDGFTDVFEEVSRLEHVYSTVYYTTLATLKPRFKDSGFTSEKEHRIYLEEGEAEATAKYFKDTMSSPVHENSKLFENISNHIYELASKLKILRSDLQHGVFRDGIRSYYVLDLEEIWSDTLITEVVLGPKCFQNKKELKSFMKACDLYRTKISVSKIPLR